MITRKIAALFVERDGIYAGRHDVEVWDVSRDARLYGGPHPVVAHPPCERWGRYHHGGPSARTRMHKGHDAGCFYVALWAVRTFGGILEHPEASAAWSWFGLIKPPRGGGWIKADKFGGWTCCVEQGQYGHPARKATWLYAARCALPDLRWGRAEGDFLRLDEGFSSAAARKAARGAGTKPRKRLSGEQRLATPPAFAEVLISIARSRREDK